jgi:hypothetical protein
MTWPIPNIDEQLTALAYRSTRISEVDAARQRRTVEAVLTRLADRPGLVLADEVGMGKTFVALGVATAAALSDRGRNPAVVMIPPSLQEKWPRDAEVFRGQCLAPDAPAPRFASAPTALDFFRLLDDPPSRRPHVIFLHHGAFHLTRIDHWTRLALIARAMRSMRLGERRSALPRFAGAILRVKSTHNDPPLYERLLQARYEHWREIINAHYEDRPDRQVIDDPVPATIVRVLERRELDLGDLRSALAGLPARDSANLEDRLEVARAALRTSLAALWPQIIREARFRAPLLVLDEAHHLKNPGTRLASLFADESRESLDSLAGAFNGRFERMLFLTATPFQLGHNELVEVLKRFRAIQWKTLGGRDPADYDRTLGALSASLDKAQQIATQFDRAWQRIPPELGPPDTSNASLDAWWTAVCAAPSDAPGILSEVRRSYEATRQAMAVAEAELKPWIIRHRRSQFLPDSAVLRRVRHTGRSILPDDAAGEDGLPVTAGQLLPFLLAARAQSIAEHLAPVVKERYLTFSEGLASSYEAFLETSKGTSPAVDDSAAVAPSTDPRLHRYLDRLQRVLPSADDYGRHPKVSAVVRRVVQLWALGEKVVVFCHYRRTGHALERHLSQEVERRLWADLEERTGIPHSQARDLVQKFGERFDRDDPLARDLAQAVAALIADEPSIGAPGRAADRECERLQEIVRRFVRSSIFVARYFDISVRSSRGLMHTALETADAAGISLRERLRAFLKFYASRDASEREEYLVALERVQPGLRGERIGEGSDAEAGASLLPNVRLANGATKQDTRQRLMLSFNTPFFPDILIASSVLAEGVDLHLNCRHMIHHDLSWNPSDIEQRTGRVDRLGSKAESLKRSVEVYLPFVAETQDEKQFRVVIDRERWFQVLMGEEYQIDAGVIDQMAARIPLPPSLAHQLAFELSLLGEAPLRRNEGARTHAAPAGMSVPAT